MLSWDLPKQNRFFTRALEFIAAKFGGKQNILAAAIHRDESTPHMQVILAPVNAEGRFSASKMVGGRDQLSQLQTDFHAACGAPFDLERGIPRTAAKHVPVRAFYGAMEAGLEPPAYVPVPPAPTMIDNLKGTYRAKQESHEAALSKNAAIRKEVNKQAQRGRTVHPRVVKKQADLYRKTLYDQANLKTQTDKLERTSSRLDQRAASLEKQAAAVQVEIKALDGHRAVLDGEVRQVMGNLVGIVDRFSGTIKPEYRAMLAQELGIELKAGKLLDQIRRAGLVGTAQEALELLDQVTSGEFSQAAQRQAERDLPRPG
jgi:hypothetical protein